MARSLPVVVGVDGSSSALDAVRWAAREAALASRHTLVLCYGNGPQVGGDQGLQVEAARVPRSAIELDVYRSNLTGGFAMFGLARLLDDLAFSLHVGDEVHHVVVSGAMDIARHVTRYLLPTVQADGHRGPVP